MFSVSYWISFVVFVSFTFRVKVSEPPALFEGSLEESGLVRW